MNRLYAYIIMDLLFLFFLTASIFSAVCQYYYRSKDELFPLPLPRQQLSATQASYSADTYDTYPAENNISVSFLAEL